MTAGWLALLAGLAASHAAPTAPWLDFTLSSSAIARRCAEAKAEASSKLDLLAQSRTPTFDATLREFSNVLADFSDAISAPTFLGEVSVDAAVRDASRACDTDVSRFLVDVYGREDLYRALKAFAGSGHALAGEEARLLEKTLLDFKRNGLELPKDKREEIQALRKRIVELETEFRKALGEEKTLVSFTREQLAGVPADMIARLARDGERTLVSLDYPDYFPFMENASDPAARRELERKFSNRGGEANVRRLAEALKLRREAARLLGYPSHAHFVLEERMAKTPEAARAFLAGLLPKLERKGRDELAELARLKEAEEGRGADRAIRAWDWRYYDVKRLRTRYQVDDQAIKEYFPLETVTAGMLEVYQTLLGLVFREVVPADAWHPDVRLFKVTDKADGSLVGHFYMDLFPREGKYKHAAAFTLVAGRSRPDGSYQPPIAAMVANFEKPTAEKPSLLRHREVETFFHEFGHIMHQVLTRAKYRRFSGTRVARDFVEAPSQMLENWVWRADIVERLSGHYREPKRKLPKELLDRMIAAKTVNAGITYLRQAMFASVDLAYHLEPVADTTALWQKVASEISLVPMTPGTHPEAGFGHIMGGYDAGYYGYLWSKVYAQDMFSRFEQSGPLDPQTGGAYRRIILERGGSVDESASLREFLGREPSDAAFLKSIGLEP
ncbi:MAG: Zn-dependent oligopeptidase [Elusimicrobia bacterium]|nr:Zn-dependent oligopeptidase [Elusimicrobiota bacterium]